MATQSISQNRFYVYVLRRSDCSDPFESHLAQPFYIGKGTKLPGRGSRFREHIREARNTTKKSLKLEVIRYLLDTKQEIIHEVIAQDLPEHWAHAIERYLISYYGRIADDGILTNRSRGGIGTDGATGYKMPQHVIDKTGSRYRGKTFSVQHCARISETQKVSRLDLVGKPLLEETLGKISAALTGKRHTQETREEMSDIQKIRGGRSTPIMINFVYYSSFTAGWKNSGMSKKRLKRFLLEKVPGYCYVEDQDISFHPAEKRFFGNNQWWKSKKVFMEHLGITAATFWKLEKAGVFERGEWVEPREKKPAKIPIEIDGIQYPSKNAGARAYGMTKEQFNTYLKKRGIYPGPTLNKEPSPSAPSTPPSPSPTQLSLLPSRPIAFVIGRQLAPMAQSDTLKGSLL